MKYLFKKFSILVFATILLPFVSKAETVGDLLNKGTNILLKGMIPLLFTLATVAFMWGVIQYFVFPDNEEKRKKAKGYMIWGLVGLFVMVSMWAIVGALSNTFFEGGSNTFLPQLSQTR